MTSAVPSAALIGPGAIGVTFAAALQDATGVEPMICARRPLAGPPVLVRDDGTSHTLGATAVTDPAAVDGPVDWVLCAVKAHQVEGAAGWLRALCGPDTAVVALMNGIEHEALLRPHVGDATVVPAVVWAPVGPDEPDGDHGPGGARSSAPTRYRVRGDAAVTVPDDEAGRRFAALLDGGFGVVTLSADFAAEAWRKLLTNAVAGLMAVADEPAWIFREPDVAAVARDIATEAAAVAAATGVRLPADVADEVVAWCAALPPDATSSIVVDRRAGRPLEWDARNGVIGRLGRAHGVPTPASDTLTALLRLGSPPAR